MSSGMDNIPKKKIINIYIFLKMKNNLIFISTY